MKKILTLFLFAMPLLAAGPYQATGFKVGEVTDNSAIVWTRLTANEKALERDPELDGPRARRHAGISPPRPLKRLGAVARN